MYGSFIALHTPEAAKEQLKVLCTTEELVELEREMWLSRERVAMGYLLIVEKTTGTKLCINLGHGALRGYSVSDCNPPRASVITPDGLLHPVQHPAQWYAYVVSMREASRMARMANA